MNRFTNPLELPAPDLASTILEGIVDDLNNPTRSQREWEGSMVELRAMAFMAALFKVGACTAGEALRFGLEKLGHYVRDQIRKAKYAEAVKVILDNADRKGW